MNNYLNLLDNGCFMHDFNYSVVYALDITLLLKLKLLSP